MLTIEPTFTCFPILPSFISNPKAMEILHRLYEEDPQFIVATYYKPDEVIMIPCHTIFPFPLLRDDS